MRVKVYEHSGFCSGVRRAIKLAEDTAGEQGEVYTLGPLVHNEEVVNYLREKGIRAIDSPDEIEKGTVIIRSHGVGPELFDLISRRPDLEIKDATCPRVKKVQETAKKLVEEGYQVLLWGKTDHPEVKGIVEWAQGKVVVVSSIAELSGEQIRAPAALLSQTTMEEELFWEAAETFKSMVTGGQVYDTICPAVKKLQSAAAEIASGVDLMIVIGSARSSNTDKLLHLCRRYTSACRVACPEEINSSMFKGVNSVGVIAGASTPPWIIKEVIVKMEEEKKELMDLEENGHPVDETEESKEPVNEAEEIIEQMDEPDRDPGAVKEFREGDPVKGVVSRVEENIVLVDIGYKNDAILSRSEVNLEPDELLPDRFSPGMEVHLQVVKVDEQDENIFVSQQLIEREKCWERLEEALEQEYDLDGTVKEVVPAGIIINLGGGIEGFMPGSLVSTRYIPDFNQFLGEKISFKVIEINRERDKVILSRKKLLEKESENKKRETLESLKSGDTVKGIVRRLTEFGAFVDVGGIDGLVHISEISWERVEHPKELLKVGEEIDVKVLEVIPEKERISLSVRRVQPDPWSQLVERFKVGELVQGKVTRLVNFGAFVELMPGVEGLVHVSQISDYHVKHPSEELKKGDTVNVKILDMRPSEKRISLSIKEASSFSRRESPVKTDEDNGGSGVTLGDVFGDLFEKNGLSD